MNNRKARICIMQVSVVDRRGPYVGNDNRTADMLDHAGIVIVSMWIFKKKTKRVFVCYCTIRLAQGEL